MTKAPMTQAVRDIQRHLKKERSMGLPQWPTSHPRPVTRGECYDLPRPCPYVGCRYHTFLHETPYGGVAFPHGDDVDALHNLQYTCVLDAADDGPQPAEAVAALLNVSRQATDTSQRLALAHIKHIKSLQEQAGCDDGPDAAAPVRHNKGKRGAAIRLAASLTKK